MHFRETAINRTRHRLAGLLVCGLVTTSVPHFSWADNTEPSLFSGLTCTEIGKLEKRKLRSLSVDELISLGMAQELGECAAPNLLGAYQSYREAAYRGKIMVQPKLGYFYMNGLGVEANLARARYWFRSFALNVFQDDDFLVDKVLEATFDDEPVPEMLIQEIERAINEAEGPADASMRNYRDLLSGNGVHRNPRKAVSWLVQASSKGHPEATYHLALRYKHGDVVEKNMTTYRIYLQTAARFNDPAAQAELGKLFLTGEGTRKWPFMAMVWFLRAQKNGLNVDELIQEAERQLDPLDHKSALMRAAEFDSGRTMQ